MMGDSGGLTVDNLSVEYAGVVFAIAESPHREGRHLGRHQRRSSPGDAGRRHARGSNVTAGLPGLPPKMTVSSVEPSRYERGHVLRRDRRPPGEQPRPVAVTRPRTTDDVDADRRRHPEDRSSATRTCVREDPKRKGLLYAGTENGALRLVRRRDVRGSRCRSTCRTAPVHWLTIQEHFNDLVVGTYGRGFWIMDDVTPLQQLDGGGAAEGRAPVRASSGVPVPERRAARPRARRRRHWGATRRTARPSTSG